MKYATKFVHIAPSTRRIELVTSTCDISPVYGEVYPIGSSAEVVCSALGNLGWSIVAAFPGLSPGSGVLIFERVVSEDDGLDEGGGS